MIEDGEIQFLLSKLKKKSLSFQAKVVWQPVNLKIPN